MLNAPMKDLATSQTEPILQTSILATTDCILWESGKSLAGYKVYVRAET
jgi:hypothetical protein